MSTSTSTIDHGKTLPERYDALMHETGFDPDPAQREVACYLQEVAHALQIRTPRRGLGRLVRRSEKKGRWPMVRGLYLYGPVGRGKTWLMDLFYDAVPLQAKQRTHFHRFLQEIHTRRRRYKHLQDPLVQIAAELASEIRLLCFDEFYVEDVGDAMILGRLMEALFLRGVTIVATSNTAPDDLYAGGLQRERFLPVIALIKKNMREVCLDGGEDYRLRALSLSEIYRYPLDRAAATMMETAFRRLTGQAPGGQEAIEILDRKIACRGDTKSVAWFDFSALCLGPRAASDYIELANRYSTLLINCVPRMTDADNNTARRFINLVDEMYDRRVKLIVTAETHPENLYQGKRLQSPFERTASRLIEMQSREYLEQAHLARG